MCVAPLSATAFLFEFFFQVWVGFGQGVAAAAAR
jgi:hypothetical protein